MLTVHLLLIESGALRMLQRLSQAMTKKKWWMNMVYKLSKLKSVGNDFVLKDEAVDYKG